jgi:hypothetical protein
MATDMLTQIEDGMKNAILGMREGPYFFTWGTVNDPDMARQEFPSAEIMLLEEENLDEDTGAHSGAYMNRATYEIVVRARLPQEVTSGLQVYEINEELNKALSDLKKLFGINYNLSACFVVRYQRMRREREPQGDLLIPKRMIAEFTVDYVQDRSDPTTGADGA